MEKSYRVTSKKVLWAMAFVSIILLSFIAYNRLKGTGTEYYCVNANMNGLSLQMDFAWDSSYLLEYYHVSEMAYWLGTILSVVFLVNRFFRTIKVRNRETEELILSYPVSRKQIIKKEMSHSGYAIWLCVFYALFLLGVVIIEHIKTSNVQEMLGNQVAVISVSIQIVLRAVLALGLLLLAVAWHYFCEIVCKERVVGFFFGSLGIVVYNCLLWGNLAYVNYLEYDKKELLVTAGIIFIVYLLASLLFIINVKLYEKIDFSKSGAFYFGWVRYFYISCACLILLFISGVFSEENAIYIRILLLLLDLAIMVALNFLALAPEERKNRKIFLCENVKNLFLVIGMTIVVGVGIGQDIGLFQEEDVYDNSWMYIDECHVTFEEDREYEDFVNTTKQKQADICLPQNLTDIKFTGGSCNYLPDQEQKREKIQSYFCVMEGEADKKISICFERGYDENYSIIESGIDVNRVKIIANDKNQIIFMQDVDAAGTNIQSCISVYKYYDSNEYFDHYVFMGNLSVKELRVVVEKFMEGIW